MAILGAAEFKPDEPDLADATNIASNVIALTADSYGPLNSLIEFSTNALDAGCIGLGYGADVNLVHHTFGGTPTKIWAINGVSQIWADVSGGTYAAGTENWHFAQYKNLMLATDFNDPIQTYDMVAGGTFAELSVNAPNARYIAVAKGFAIVGNTNDPVGGRNPARIWWSSSNDPTTWPTPGSSTAQQNQSDFSDLNGPQGAITGLAPNLTGCDCAIFFERAVFRMIYAGPPVIFDVYPAASVKGCPAPNSIVPLGTVVYYLGEDGFYMFDGNYSVPIGANKVDKWFFAQLDTTAFNLVIGAPDIANKAIIWLCRTVYATSPLPNLMVIYRWDIGRWTYGMLNAEWIGRIPVADNVPDTPLTEGQLQLAVVDSANKLAYFSGTPMAAQIGTKVVQITPESRSFVFGSRPLVKIGFGSNYILASPSNAPIVTAQGSPLLTGSDVPVTFSVAMSARNTYYESEVFGPDITPDISGQCPVRSDGRYHRGRISISGGTWTAMAGLDVQAIRSGLR